MVLCFLKQAFEDINHLLSSVTSYVHFPMRFGEDYEDFLFLMCLLGDPMIGC